MRAWQFRSLESLEDRALFAMAGVDVFNSSFLPNPVTIHVGDTVQWVWDTNGFSTTSVAGSLEQWDSGIHNAGFMFEHTFNNVGTFDYYSTAGGTDNGNGTASGVAGEIIVLPPSPLMMVMVTPNNFNLSPSGTEQYMAMGMYADNTVLDLSADVTWASTNPSVASVSTSPATAGLVTGVSQGTASISATFDGMMGSTPVVVSAPATQEPPASPPPPPSVTLTSVTPTFSKHHVVRSITVTFSGAIDPADAGRISSYHLEAAGRHGSFTARNARAIKLKSAVYDSSASSVTLRLRKPFALTKPIELRLNGTLASGLTDNLGRPIDGNGDGSSGGDTVIVIGPKRVTIV